MDSQEFAAAREVYNKTGDPGMCARAGADCDPSPKATHYVVELLKKEGGRYRTTIGIEDQFTSFPDLNVGAFSPYCKKHAEIAQSQKESLALESDPPLSYADFYAATEAYLIPWEPENLPDTVDKLSGPGLATLRSRLGGQFGILLQSAIDAELTQIIFQTIGASPKTPYLVKFEQIILDPFTGLGQFDLVERDARRRVFDGASAGGTPVLTSATMNFQSSDAGKFIRVGINPGRYYSILSRQSATLVTLSANITLPSSGLTLTMDGSDASEVTIATKAGFEDVDTPRLTKVLTVDKVYSVIFVPGDAGIGAYSISVRGLNGKRK